MLPRKDAPPAGLLPYICVFELDMYVAEQTFEACGEGTRTGREIPLVLIDGIRRARVYLCCVEVCAVSESDEVARKSVL